MRKEPHQMRGSELRNMKQELERRLRECRDQRQSQELRRRIEELAAELRRRSHIGKPGHGPSDRPREGASQSPSQRAEEDTDK